MNSYNNKNVSSKVVNRINRVAFCNKWDWGTPGGNKVQNTIKLLDFHYLLLYNWKNEGVTTKSLNSNNNTNVSMNVVHRIDRMAFCNKWVWDTHRVIMYRYAAKLFGFHSVCSRISGKMKVLQ